MEPSPVKFNVTHPLNQVCLVIDMDGYRRGSDFIPRELGWCNHDNTDCDSIHYYPRWPYSFLSDRDQRTAHYIYQHIHGLNYYPGAWKDYPHFDDLKQDLVDLYNKNKTPERRTIAYKGGHVEKDLLKELKLPSFNLEEAGCPKLDHLPRLRSMASCGQHIDPLNHHCPKVECYHFVQWMRSRQHLPYDQRYVNTHRVNRFLTQASP